MERAHLEIDLLTLPVTRKNGKQAMFDVIESQLRVLTWRNSSNSMNPSPLLSKTLNTKLKRVGEKFGYWKSVACKYQVHFIAQRKHMVQIKLTLRMKSDLLLEKTWFCFWINSKACWNMLRVNSVGIRWVSESAHGVRWWRRIFRHVTLSYHTTHLDR